MVTIKINGQDVDVADLTPPGVISAFGGTVAPSGYLLCDGSPVSRTTYANLFAAIGTAYGSGDGSSTFNVPDLRGQFLRGVDGSAGIDPDKASRTALKSGGNTGDAVGSAQGSATKLPNTPFTMNTGVESASHSHNLPLIGAVSGSGALNAVDLVWTPYYPTSNAPVSTESAQHTHSANTWGGGDHESRPTNVYVNYIIKT